jgi:hypothetical protein
MYKKLMSLAFIVSILNLDVWKSYSSRSVRKASLFRNFVLVGHLLVASFLLTAIPAAYAEDMYALEVGVGMTVTIDDDDDVLRLSSYTYELWLKDLEGPTGSWRRVFHKGLNNVNTGRGPLLSLRPDDPGLHFAHSTGSAQQTANVTEGVPLNEWLHIALVLTDLDGDQIIYQDGVEVARNDVSGLTDATQEPVLQIAAANAASVVVDDFRIWNYARTQEEIQADMNQEVAGVEEGLVGYWRFNEGEGTTAYDLSPYENHGTFTDAIWTTDAAPISAGKPKVVASRPDPADGTLIEDTWANLSWSPGDLAVSHDIYIGDDFDAVNQSAEGTFIGNQTGTFIVVGFPGMPLPDGLVPGTTYYWRIDEVNEAEPNSPWKGNIWSFNVPPKTAYFPDPADSAEGVSIDVKFNWTGGYGSKLHTVYFGETFDEVDNATGGSAQGTTTYNPGPLKMAQTYYWRVDEFDIIETHKGHVWSFTTQGAVGNPNPANGAVDVKQTPILTWSPSVFAASHEVYFGTEKDAMKNADTGSPEYKGTRDLGAESYGPGKLELDATYYWRIDEVNNTNPDSPWPGILWSFTTADFLVVDDFEDYDSGDNQIWYIWKDGLGYAAHGNEPAYPGNGTGSAVGDESTASFTEETIVHGGNQSMPFWYDNSILMYSEVEKTLTYPRDWTEGGAVVLSIWFRGNSDNAAEAMYVALNGSAVVTHDNPNAAQIDEWTEWTIDLQAFADLGVNLANVNNVAIGFGDKNNPLAGGSGMMYFDDIRLYRPAP